MTGLRRVLISAGILIAFSFGKLEAIEICILNFYKNFFKYFVRN